MSDTFTVETLYGKYADCTLDKGEYRNGHIAYQIMSPEGPIALLTVNIDGIESFPKNCSCVDVNNFPEGEAIITMLGIGKPIGINLSSGWCSYPVYEFKKELRLV